MIAATILVIFPLCMIYAAVSDMQTMTIPNRISLALIAAFIVLAPLAGLDLATIGYHALGALIVFGVCFGLFAANVMGGGDAKFLTATALWFGFGYDLIAFLVMVGFFGGILTLAILMMRSPVGFYLVSRLPMTHHLTNAKAGIPYGIAIGAAGLACMTSSPLMVFALGQLG